MYNNDSVNVELGDVQNRIDNGSEDATIHSNEENIIINIPTVDSPANYGKNQILILQVDFAPASPSRVNIHTNKRITIVQFSKNNLEQEIMNFVKQSVVLKGKYAFTLRKPNL